jgi:hypothetical protein
MRVFDNLIDLDLLDENLVLPDGVLVFLEL